jgi:hypothetical protein
MLLKVNHSIIKNNKMKQRNLLMTMFAILMLITSSCVQQNIQEEQGSRKLEIKNGAYYINNQKTFINALGYEIAARPGQHPYQDEKVLEIARMKNDLRVIKDAGFNAVRTWSELTEDEVKLIQESGLMLVYGIWILPDGDFNKPQFINDAKKQVKKVMAWSKNYDCIITYLIMNEPMVAHIHDKGAQNTFDLWKSLVAIIHEEHPGIPVTISNNSAIGEYLNERIFDVYGFNTYDYHEGLPGFTQGFANHFKYLKELNGENKPVLVTEFGMSVSPIGYGMYGGNTRKQQASHIIQNFSDLLDAEVNGVCPFYYADGWWKAGEPAVHNPYPEEWFGYWAYADVNDTVGYPRPIWYEFKRYNQALVTAPRNQHIYTGKVPVEVFAGNEAKSMRVIYNDKVIYENQITAYQTIDSIDFNEQGITDRELIFEFYNAKNELLKWESICVLTSKTELTLPKIVLEFNETDLSKSKKLKTSFAISNDTIFKLDNSFKIIYSHHQGWDAGVHRTHEIIVDQPFYSFNDVFEFSDDCFVLNVGAGVDIKYGKFVKRIHAEKLLYRGNWADPIKVD